MRRQTLVAVMAILETDPSITEEQSDLVSEVLNGRLKKGQLQPPSPFEATTKDPLDQSPKGYMNKIEAAKYIGVSGRYLDMYRSRGKLSCYKIGSRVLFKKTDLDDFVSSWRIDTSDE